MQPGKPMRAPFLPPLIALALVPVGAFAQTPPAQDATQRSLQERAAQERGLSLRLDDRPPPPRPMAPDEIRRNITLPTPGTEILRREPPPLIAPTPRVAAPGPAVPSSQQLLDESQRRRQLELQTQLPPPNTPTPDPAQGVIRQQQQQTQQLQFEREQRAGSLGSEIMRESDRALRR